MSQRWIQTYTGWRFFPLDPRPDDVDLLDIAHALAMKPRFTGHCKRHYSIAEHCLRVAEAMANTGCPIRHQLWGLMHDCAQAYLPDVPAPYKEFVQITTPGWPEDEEGTVWHERTFEEVEERVASVICTALGVEIAGVYEVAEYDKILLATEVRDLVSTAPLEDWADGLPEPLTEKIESTMGWELAEKRFLLAYRELRLEMG